MVVKKKNKGKDKRIKKKIIDEEDEENGEVEDGESEEEIENNINNVEESVKKLQDILNDESDIVVKVEIKTSKPISALKKGDNIKVDDEELKVDAHYVLIDHGNTKERTIDLFNPKTDKEYQLRYFSDQVETSIEFYELEEKALSSFLSCCHDQ